MSFVQEHTNDDGQGWPYAVEGTTAGMQEVERIRRQSRGVRSECKRPAMSIDSLLGCFF